MACFKPLRAYRNSNGAVVFHDNGTGQYMELPCGQCIGCRLERSRQWAVRCVNEQQMHDENVFITLTYNDENIPRDGGLVKRHFQDFIRELRRQNKGKKIRYYQCGEYGGKTLRPHYHAILFNHNFHDWDFICNSDSGEPIYTSSELESIWKKGFVTVGDVTFKSAAYIARYCMKKLTGKQADVIDEQTGLKHYERIHIDTGEIVEVIPEYTTMSRRPGIGSDWFDKYSMDFYTKDYALISGNRMRPPRYYDKKLKEINPILYDDLKAHRMYLQSNSEDSSESRLSQREKVKEAQLKNLKRGL